MNVLFFKLSPIGDTVMFLPVVQELRRMRPDWRLTVVTTPVCAELFSSCLGGGDIVALDRTALQRSWRSPRLFLAHLLRVRRLRPDAAMLSFDQSSMARILAVASGAGLRVGGSGSVVRWQGGLTHEVSIQHGHTLAQWEWEMARVLLKGTDVPWPSILPAPLIRGAAAGQGRRRPRVLVHPGASREYQRWPAARYAELASRLASAFDVVWIQTPEIAQACPPPPVKVSTPRSISDFVSLAENADLFVGNHSGAFHLACAVGIECVIPTGPALPTGDPPWNASRRRMLRRTGLSCMPCDQLVNSAHRCLNTLSPMACLEYWSVDAVEHICREVLAQLPAAP